MKAAFLSLLALTLVTGCSKGGFSQRRESEASAGVLTYAIPVNPTTLDPGRVQDTETGDLLQNIYEPLVTYNEENKLVPQLAESWTVEDGGKTYVFKLRENAKFHNGRNITAADVKYTLERNLNPAFDSPTASNYLGAIVGVDDYAKGKTKEIAGVEATDERTVKIRIDKPRPYFIGTLAYPCAYVVAKEATGGKEIAKPEEAIGTGPFRLAGYKAEQSVTLEAFADYYLGAPKVQRIERPVIKDAATRLNKYKKGELDYIGIVRQDLPAIKEDATLSKQLVFLPRPAFYYLSMNKRVYPPFADRRVRRAVAMAINREKIAEDVLGEVPVAHSFIPPGVPGYREAGQTKALPYDPAAAKQELAAAGFPGAKGLPPLYITIREQTVDSRMAAESMASDLQKNLGMTVKLKTMEWRALFEARNAKKLASYHGSWFADYLDPENFLSFIMSGDTTMNFDSYQNADFDRLCAQADVDMDEKRRIATYQQAEDIALQDAARVPIYYGRDAILVGPRVTGLKNNLFGQLPHLTTAVRG